METTLDEKNKLREIVQRLIAGDKQWFDDKEIVAKSSTDSWILNYNIGGKNDYNRLVRGLVVQKPQSGFNGDPLQLIRSFPFIRFFNQQEPTADQVDMNDAEMLEKLDGTMVGVYFPDGNPQNPQWHTRKMMSTNPDDYNYKVTAFHGGQYQLLAVIGKYVKALPFTQADVANTYVFEFIHESSFVWTKYTPEQYGLYLLGARNVSTHKEQSEKELDATAARIKVKRPRRWDSVASHSEIMSLMKQIEKETPGFEGFVFRDKKTGKRIKIKDPDYVKYHAMLDKLSYKNLVVKVLEGETDEILAYFPSAKEKIEKIILKYNQFLTFVVGRVIYWRNKKLDRKSLAMEIFHGKGETNRWIASAVMGYYTIADDQEIIKNVDKDLRKLAMGKSDSDSQGSPRKLLDLIGINDDDDTDSNKDS